MIFRKNQDKEFGVTFTMKACERQVLRALDKVKL